MRTKLIILLICLILIYDKGFANNINQIDGEWYSYKWKYGYTLKNGKGFASISNSINFDVGQEIVSLKAVGGNSFVGANVYKDGLFYKVKATLQPDGKLLFEGEKNVKWEMERIESNKLSELKKSKNIPADMVGVYYPETPDQCEETAGFESRLNIGFSRIMTGSIMGCYIESVKDKNSFLEATVFCGVEGGGGNFRSKYKLFQIEKESIYLDGKKYKRCK